jgi:hypothetical protein
MKIISGRFVILMPALFAGAPWYLLVLAEPRRPHAAAFANKLGQRPSLRVAGPRGKLTDAVRAGSLAT